MKLSIEQRKQSIVKTLNALYNIMCEITFRNQGAFTIAFVGNNELALQDIKNYLQLNGGSVTHNFDAELQETFVYYDPIHK